MQLLAPLLFLANAVSAVSPLINLNYSTYEGEALANGVTQWLGLRFAAPPVGDLRFAAPQDPLQTNGTQPANKVGPICLPTGGGPPSSDPFSGNITNPATSEDCLFMNVFAPSNASCDEPLPVYFFIQGGGFNSNSNPNYNGSGLIIASNHNIVVATINYRVGPYGFLAGKEVESLNNGLLDQRKALYWVQKYISQFGGDPKHVTMGGDSAGAQSVTLHVTAYGGRNDNLFQAVASESQSFSGLRTSEQNQFAYNNLTIRANCSSAPDTLACLRNLTATQLQSINYNIPFPGATNPPLYMYGPTLDYDLISDYTYRAYAQGKFIRTPAIYGDDTNEGTIFTPKNTSSYAESDTFLHDQFPNLTDQQEQIINSLYPVQATQQYPDSGRFWRQVSNAYGSMRYICPGIFISQVYGFEGVPEYNYRWNVIDPVANEQGYGVSHTIETNAIWGPEYVSSKPPASYEPGGVNYGIVAPTQAYWTSFIRTYNPNTYRLPGSPTWEAFEGFNFNQRLMFQTNNTHMEQISGEELGACAYLTSLGVGLEQ